MKKIYCFLLILAMLTLTFGGCKKVDNWEYNAEKMRTPFWTHDIMYNESVLMIQSQEGELACGNLAFNPTGKLRIYSPDMQTIYKEGSDYTLDGRKITRTENSSMPYLKEEVLYAINLPEGQGLGTQPASATAASKGYSKVLYTESSFLIRHQVLVTYDYSRDEYSGYIPQNQLEKLPNLKSKLEKSEAFQMVVYGDSISTGCNSTGGGLINNYGETSPDVYIPFDIPPYTPTWPEMVVKGVTAKYGSQIDLLSASRGGMDSNWGKNNAVTRAYNINYGYNPEVVIIGFGMNDGTTNMSDSIFKSNIESIITQIREASEKEVEFILVGSMMCNEDAIQFGRQDEYFKLLEEISNSKNGVIAVDIGQTHKFFLENKRFNDMAVNGVNHPNDFVIRLYAMNILASLI